MKWSLGSCGVCRMKSVGVCGGGGGGGGGGGVKMEVSG
jgi:hypothetical protein